jgi:molecular chaperone GrpE
MEEKKDTEVKNEQEVNATPAESEVKEVKDDAPQKQEAPKKQEKERKEEAKKDEAKKDEKALENALKELEEMKAKAADANDKYLRMAAEFDNFRRRTAKERLDLVSTASEDVIKGLLPVLDDFDHALRVLKETNSSKECIDGTELIYKKLTDYLKTKGVSEMNVMGETFDSELHEAIAQLPAKDESQKNKVVEVVQKGYTLNGKIIRYAKVIIGI